MKILLVHQMYSDDRQPGGSRHFELAKRLAARGHEVTIVTGNRCYLSGRRFAFMRKRREEYHGITVLRSYTLPTLHWGLAGKVLSFISFMVTSLLHGICLRRVDVVIGTNPPIFQLLPTWLMACWHRRPFVMEVRDLWPAFAVDMGVLKNRWIIRLAEWFERFFYRRAVRIIVNSPAYVDYLLDLNIPREKIRLIPNGVDPAVIAREHADQRTRDSYGLNGQFLVTYAGALGLANDVPTMLSVAQCLRNDLDVHLLLVGEGLLKREAQETIAKLHLKNVTVADGVPKDRIADVLATSDACLATLRDIPMFRMTYPNKVFDYMAAGRPTVLAIGGVIKDVIEKAHGGVCVPPGDAPAIAQAVRYLRDNREEAARMGASANDYVTEHFHRDDHARLLEAALLEVAA